MSIQNNKNVLLRLAEAVNTGNLGAVDDVRHDPSDLLRDAGVKEYKQAFSKVRSAFPDAQWTLH